MSSQSKQRKMADWAIPSVHLLFRDYVRRQALIMTLAAVETIPGWCTVGIV